MKKAAIVGIDPGLRTAVAIVDLRGEVLNLRSRKGFSLGEILSFISEECNPVMIASDVSPPPKLLQKVAAAFSVKVHEPPRNLSRKTKSRLLRPYGLSERDRHKRDAMAAAVSAFRSVTYMLRRIDDKLSSEGLSGTISTGEVAVRIISRESRNISSAIEYLREENVRNFAPGLPDSQMTE